MELKTKSVKIWEVAHRAVRFLPALDVQMQTWMSICVLSGMRRQYPEFYKRAVSNIEGKELRYIESLIASYDADGSLRSEHEPLQRGGQFDLDDELRFGKGSGRK